MSSGLLRRVVWQTFIDVSDVLAFSIIRTIIQKTAICISLMRLSVIDR
jgi:hypothetical protein